MSERDNSSSAVLAFLLGGVLGAAAALLLAPASGQKTRRKVREWLDEIEEKGKDFWEEKEGILQEGKEVLEEKVEKLKRAAEAGRKAFNKEFAGNGEE